MIRKFYRLGYKRDVLLVDCLNDCVTGDTRSFATARPEAARGEAPE
jgi:hypothetical protein